MKPSAEDFLHLVHHNGALIRSGTPEGHAPFVLDLNDRNAAEMFDGLTVNCGEAARQRRLVGKGSISTAVLSVVPEMGRELVAATARSKATVERFDQIRRDQRASPSWSCIRARSSCSATRGNRPEKASLPPRQEQETLSHALPSRWRVLCAWAGPSSPSRPVASWAKPESQATDLAQAGGASNPRRECRRRWRRRSAACVLEE
jgi:hypothetical protein